MGFVWTLVIGGIIEAIAEAIINKGSLMGIIANIIAGLVGSAIGQALLRAWRPTVAGVAIIPSSTGAVILVLVAPLFARKL